MKPAEPTGAVLVIGGGIGGIQASLDLANSGFRVYLLERLGAIGGAMAALDKTFPTNDCSMCILSPKLVECGRHLNIELLTNSELLALEGVPGAFIATVEQKPRYVDIEKCTGCGECAGVCPVRLPDAFNRGFSTRKAIYRLYEQAHPPAYQIDMNACRRCGLCARTCAAWAVDLSMEPVTHRLEVGAVVACPGFETFDAARIANYGYGLFPNVITGIEFERILSASGPTRGNLRRPSDGRMPRRIAWIQCVGSRDIHRVNNGYCSSVCCTSAIKEAVVAREHGCPDLEATVFHIDIRTHGKGFERYFDRARNEHGVRFARSEIHRVFQDASGDLILRYPEGGAVREEVFDLVVLSTGMVQSAANRELAARLGIELDEHGFCVTDTLSPVDTSVPGVFAAGAFTGPRDIPETVMGASAAASRAAELLSRARHSSTRSRKYPPEKPFGGSRPRIGVFVCRCGINIAGVVDVEAVRDHAAGLPNVVYAVDTLFACSQDSQRMIREAVSEHGLNRVVVAACTPRTHEPLFQETLREAGLNKHLFEMANIRDQCSWVHQAEPGNATAKAMDLVRMSAARARLMKPLAQTSVGVERSALVIGGGVAGMVSASALADQGFGVHLVESSGRLGGNALRLRSTLDGSDVASFVKGLSERVSNDPSIDLHLGAQVTDVAGFVGSFRSTVEEADGRRVEIVHGAAVIATGAEPHTPSGFLYGLDPGVLTLPQLEERISAGDPVAASCRNVVLIQCAGSREPGRPWCSRVCCSESLKLALEMLDRNPGIRIYILYRDIRTYGLREKYYLEARERGVRFLRYDPDDPPVIERGDREGGAGLRVTATDTVLGERFTIDADLVGLAVAVVPSGSSRRLAGLFKVPLDEDGFFMEAHAKLRPVDFPTDGVFVCGLAHGPKTIDESIVQAGAAAARASLVLCRDSIEAGGTVCVIDSAKCSGCGICALVCPFRAVEIDAEEHRAIVNEALCKGCGLCVASCRSGAADLGGFTDAEIHAMIGSFTSGNAGR
ncbi:CoB--CoM heterodisulfide reductase iron-sulfur subunit A family protein [Candidatus Fermentibacteria bacterium]|nr:CoB--CoM heterodisulfide reductase iron-sulfur subunit A family protein [Candidatus Fermentibacteria bacterium]